MTLPLVTAVVSTYNAERFMRACLEDLVQQTLFKEMEVLVIDSGSQQGESAICQEFAKAHPQIRLLRTEREPLYTAWNRAIGMARGKYITNANTDDRHRADYTELMSAALEKNPEVVLAYSDQLISHTENETHAQCVSRNAKYLQWPDYTHEVLALRCITGSQPMWRLSAHDSVGLFDTRYRITADYDMWLRFADRYPMLHLPLPLGVFYESPNTMSGSNNQLAMDLERLQIKQIQSEHMPQLRKKFAAEIFDLGYRHISRKDRNKAASLFLREAVRMHPTNPRFLKTYLLRGVMGLA